jgi:transcriptional regulator with XRE-family HTH domain
MINMNIPMNIGEWLLQRRRNRKFDLRALANRTGLDIGTISKIENGRTQATLGTIVRAGVGLEVTANDFIQDWQGQPFSLANESHVIGDETVPTLQDVETFVTCARTNRQTICVWMANSLNSIASLQGEVKPLFEPEVIEKLFFGPQWQHYEVQYPAEMSIENILDILNQTGVMILSDISAYLKKTSVKNQILSERLDALLKFSIKGGDHLEIGSVERIKMIDVLLLDQKLQQGGKIVAMYWNVCLFQEEMLRLQAYSGDRTVSVGAISAEQEVRLALVFITICRWLQHISKNDTSWIRDLRLRFRQLNILPL